MLIQNAADNTYVLYTLVDQETELQHELEIINEIVTGKDDCDVFWVIAKHRDSEHRFKQKIAELTTTNEKLQQEIAELNGEEIEILESIIDAKPSKKKIPGFNPQELRALSELARRLK
jgi:ABC-type sugar transport system ATPase subunit